MKIINNKNWNTHPSTNRSAPAQLQPICNVDTWNIKYGYIELHPPIMERMETYDTWVHLWMLKPRAVYAFFHTKLCFCCFDLHCLGDLGSGLAHIWLYTCCIQHIPPLHLTICLLKVGLLHMWCHKLMKMLWLCGMSTKQCTTSQHENVSQWNTWGVVLLWATSIQDVYGVNITQTQIPSLSFDFVGFGFFFIEFTSASISSKSSIFAFVSILTKRFFS